MEKTTLIFDEMFKSLRPREVEVLYYFKKGLANKDIAAAMGLSYHTIQKYYLPMVYAKFKIKGGLKKHDNLMQLLNKHMAGD